LAPCAAATAMKALAETDGDSRQAITQLYETLTSQELSVARAKLLEDALQGFRAHYSANPKLAKALAPDTQAPQKQAEIAAWTMLTQRTAKPGTHEGTEINDAERL
jgi:hypothetical protein